MEPGTTREGWDAIARIGMTLGVPQPASARGPRASGGRAASGSWPMERPAQSVVAWNSSAEKVTEVLAW